MSKASKCQIKQMPRNLNSFRLEQLGETPSYYVDEDYPARPEI